MDKAHFLTLYKSLIRPHLDYGNTIYYPITKKNKRILENVQRRATKLVPGLRDLPYETRLQELNLPTLEYRRQRFDQILLYKMLHRKVDFDYNKLFELSTGTHGTRGNPYKLQKPRASKSIRQHSYSHRAVNNWNNLPNEVVCATSVNSFKSRLDKLWKAKRYNLSDIY